MGAIYAIQCLANGKVYVGQTVKPSWRQRYVSHSKPQIHTSCRLLHRAYTKFGRDAFRFEDLMTDVPVDQLDFWERFWIASMGTRNPSIGYNLESGGGSQKKLSMETRARMSASQRGTHKGMKYAPWNGPRRARYKPESHGMYRPVIWKHPVHGEFVGGGKQLKEAFPEQNLKRSNLSRVIKGLRHHCGGWRYVGEQTQISTKG